MDLAVQIVFQSRFDSPLLFNLWGGETHFARPEGGYQVTESSQSSGPDFPTFVKPGALSINTENSHSLSVSLEIST